MKNRTDLPARTTSPSDETRWRVLGVALFAAVARLGVVVATATLLLILLLNEIAGALAYFLAALVALMFGHCSFAP